MTARASQSAAITCDSNSVIPTNAPINMKESSFMSVCHATETKSPAPCLRADIHAEIHKDGRQGHRYDLKEHCSHRFPPLGRPVVIAETRNRNLHLIDLWFIVPLALRSIAH